MEYKKSEELIQKYLDGNCTPEESAIVESWYNNLNSEINDLEEEPDYRKMHNRLTKRLILETPVIHIWKRVAAAAILLICLSAGYYFTAGRSGRPNSLVNKYKQNIGPGGNKAILTLSNGKQIVLNNAGVGTLARESNTAINKTASGQINYLASSSKHASPLTNAFNIITTPKGGQFCVILSDGTRVILNAASSLKYPPWFSGTERRVQLTGEAYFEVAHKAGQRFIVSSTNQLAEDVGTHFNINAYADESSEQTTLLEGAVKIYVGSKSKLLTPGQQSVVDLDTHSIAIKTLDAEDEVAWKNGYFRFSNEHIESIMRKLSRWYDIDVHYSGEITNEGFYGKVSRFKNISVVLKMLEDSKGVHFKVEGRRITVMR